MCLVINIISLMSSNMLLFTSKILKYLDGLVTSKVSGGNKKITIGDVLQFLTGSRIIPP